jgi:hypothetical protein
VARVKHIPGTRHVHHAVAGLGSLGVGGREEGK